MRTHVLDLTAYGVLIAVIVVAFLLGEVTASPYAWVVLNAGVMFGVFAAAQIGRLSYLGVALVIFALTVIAPITLVYTWGWQITSSALAMGAAGVSDSIEVNFPWLFAAVPILAGLAALSGTRRLTVRWSGR